MAERGKSERGRPHIREMAISDYDGVMMLWKSLPEMGLSSADERDQIARFIGKNPTMCLVLEDGGEVIGTVLGGWDGRRGYIYHLAVDEKSWRSGLGTMLMNELEDRFRCLGAEKVHLMIYNDNRFFTFYEKRGYVKRNELYSMSKDL